MMEVVMWIWSLLKAVVLATAVLWFSIKLGWIDWVLAKAVNRRTYYVVVVVVVCVAFWGLVWVLF
ncbi:MAG: hypothetical protein Q8K92_08445 [Leadbetterella sp.]|nr:hypothetical protein [Leadbetterella sp.]